MLEDVEDIMLKVNDIPIPDFIFTGFKLTIFDWLVIIIGSSGSIQVVSHFILFNFACLWAPTLYAHIRTCHCR